VAEAAVPKRPLHWPRKATRAHLHWLADQHDVEIDWITDKWEAACSVSARLVSVPRPLDASRYIVALHEFGHILHPKARRGHKAKRFDEAMAVEAYAWAWAVEHVIPEARPFYAEREWRLMSQALCSHLLYNDGVPWPDGWSA
jgi:hypothetical protein